MRHILIAYTTNSGSTEEVAQAVAEELRKDGNQVEVRRLEEVTSLDGYDAVVVGAPMILGWHRAAVSFVKKHRGDLKNIPVAYFCTAMSLTQTGDEQTLGIPVLIDPDLSQPPADPKRLSLKERYATVSHYLSPVLKAAPEVKPIQVGFFGGKLEMFRLKIWQAIFVMLIIRGTPGDMRNWQFIQEWAGELRSKL